MEAATIDQHQNHKLLGACSLCGYRGIFKFEGKKSVRSDYACASCAADIRHRDVAAVILDEFGRGLFTSIAQLARDIRFRAMRIYEPSLRGPFVKYFKGLPSYFQSYYWPEIALGETSDGVQCQDLRQLTFQDDSFDLIITLDVFEHVFEAEQAFRDIFRVLGKGGVHIFSIPFHWPVAPKSELRAIEIDGREKHILPPQYHVAGDGSRSLVVTDWGADLIDTLEAIGYKVAVVRRSAPLYPLHTNATFVARKL
jgi:SAM-dependent methyltransferase